MMNNILMCSMDFFRGRL